MTKRKSVKQFSLVIFPIPFYILCTDVTEEGIELSFAIDFEMPISISERYQSWRISSVLPQEELVI
jgi:hypothetical protein